MNERAFMTLPDNPDEKIKLKMFHTEIINDADKLNKEIGNYKEYRSSPLSHSNRY
jgi:hypothetical protein